MQSPLSTSLGKGGRIGQRDKGASVQCQVSRPRRLRAWMSPHLAQHPPKKSSRSSQIHNRRRAPTNKKKQLTYTLHTPDDEESNGRTADLTRTQLPTEANRWFCVKMKNHQSACPKFAPNWILPPPLFLLDTPKAWNCFLLFQPATLPPRSFSLRFLQAQKVTSPSH
jgi:hypothetical protein